LIAVSEQGNGPVDRPGDSVDRILLDWSRERPDLDFAPVGVITRLSRVRTHLDTMLIAVFARFGLTAADFQVIVTLRRAGEPFRLTQSQLAGELGLTSGTISVRMDRLTKSGVVRRQPDPNDKRGAVVELTEHGLALFDQVAPDHLNNERRLLSALAPAEQEHLADLLRKLLVSFEPRKCPCLDRLGLVLDPAHLATERRAEVGLAPTPGLLVTDLVPGQSAALAGLRRGDLLIELDGSPLLSEHDLHIALAGSPVSLAVQYLRGEQRGSTTLHLPNAT
jgi:DNA-binding MarR family transcriptional regulator